MKKFSFVATALMFFGVSLTAKAQTFTYNCRLKDGSPVQVEINKRSLTFLDVNEGNGAHKKGDLVFTYGGISESGKMTGKFVFNWSEKKSDIYNFDFADVYFVQPELVSGGMKLRNGKLGGYVSFVGVGYSYESYLCILAD